MRISVALCTYNGARFLSEQLASIRVQTRQPDEMVVCDDGSTDDTVAVLERFSAPFPVRLQRNAQRLGVTKNFEKAIGLATGDVIALADQDDIWYPHKLRVIEERIGEADMVFSDARRIDAYGRVLPRLLWEHIAFSPGRSLADVLVERNVVTGATMAFRASFRDRLLPIPHEHGMLHDQWIATILSTIGRVRAIDEPLLDYREHPEQERGVGERRGWMEMARTTGRADFAQKAAELRMLAERLGGSALQGRIEHLERRASLPDSRLARVLPVLRDLPSYLRYSNHVWSIAKDLWGSHLEN